MSLLDKLMIGGLLAACVVLIITFALLGERVATSPLVPTTIVVESPPSTVTGGT